MLEFAEKDWWQDPQPVLVRISPGLKLILLHYQEPVWCPSVVDKEEELTVWFLVAELTEEEQLAEWEKLYDAIGYSESENTVKLPKEVKFLGRLYQTAKRSTHADFKILVKELEWTAWVAMEVN